MVDRVRLGVIGTGRVIQSLHLPHLKSHPRAEIAAICGRHRERAEMVAKRFQIPSVYTDYQEMIAKGNLQAVVIGTPEDWHYSMTMDALEAGLHVLCEKPLALNAQQAREMYEKAETAGVKHMVFFTYRWMPYYRYFKELIEQGYIGRCLDCHIHYLSGFGRQPRYDWRFDRKHGNGALGDLGAHMIDFVQWFVGDIASVSADLATLVQRPGPAGQTYEPANDSAMLMLRFKGGAQGMIHASAVAYVAERGQEQQITLHGDSGTLELFYTRKGSDPARGLRKTTCEILGARQDEAEMTKLAVPDRFWGDADRSSAYELFLKQPLGDRLFVDAILDDLPISPNFYDGLKVQEVIEAALESQASGRWASVRAV